MNKTQKGACYGLLLAALLSTVPLIGAYETVLGPVIIRLVGYLVLLPLLIVPIYFLSKKRNKSEVDSDERDRVIIKRALLVAFLSTSAVSIIAYIIAYFVLKPPASIPVSRLPEILYGLFIIFILVLSVAVLVQYGRGGKDGKE